MGKPELRLLDDAELQEISVKPEPWISIKGPWPVVWPEDHSYRDACVVTPERQQNVSIKEGYYNGELTPEALLQIQNIRKKFGEVLRVFPTKYSRVSAETALFNGA